MAHRSKYWYLQQFNLFEGITDEDLMQIHDVSMEHFYRKKDLLFEPGTKLDTVYILKEGEVTLYQMHKDKRVILDILKPGSFFGNISLNPNEETTYYAEATDKVLICAFSTDSFLAIIRSYPEIVLRLLQMFTEKIREYEDRITSGALYNAKLKVLEAIKTIHKKDKGNFLPRILQKKTKITHEKLAAITGLARETVTKAIAELSEEEKILVEGRKISITS